MWSMLKTNGGVINMPMMMCPHCQTKFTFVANQGDVVHQCNSGNPVLDQEDIVVKGDWSDYTGSQADIRTNMSDVKYSDFGNKLMGNEAWIRELAKDVPRTIRGNNANIMRQRQHLAYIAEPKQG